MALDKAVDSAALDAAFSAIAAAIREKSGASASYTPEQMPQAIRALASGAAQTKSGTFTLGAYTQGYYQRAVIDCGFVPDLFVVWLEGDRYTDGNQNAWANMASAAFSLLGSRVRSYIVCEKFSSAVNLSVLLYRSGNTVDVDIFKDSSGISTATAFRYFAVKFTAQEVQP